jgi:membrane protein implicated in regulation of membrane protease activity
MLLVYAISAVVAGALVLLSAFGGDHHGGHETSIEVHHDGHDAFEGTWIPFFSLRFYTYFFASFGLAGMLLSFLTATDPVVTAWLSAGVGVATGLTASFILRLLRLSETSGGALEQDVLGKEGLVLVPIRESLPGRIRCTIRGDVIDYLAVTEAPRVLQAGETVVVVGMENGRAQVLPVGDLFGETEAETVSINGTNVSS